MKQSITILGIESSCDDTSAAVLVDGKILANSVANQTVHEQYGGVVPELASRAHQQNIVPVVDIALQQANKNIQDIDAIAFTRGPGLLGSLLVGTSFTKGVSLALDIPMIEINHMQAHILAHFIEGANTTGKGCPEFPFLCLTVSGGHTQIVLVKSPYEMEQVGTTIDDAAGEAFDKCAKIMGLPYPGGPMVDKLAQQGNPGKFEFTKPHIDGLDYSFSGLKTNFLYFLRDEKKKNEHFIEENKTDLCASLQKTIIDILIAKLEKAAIEYNISDIAIAGGVSANSGLRNKLGDLATKNSWKVFIPKFEYCTDNAAMIAMAGYYRYIKKEFAELDITPKARMSV